MSEKVSIELSLEDREFICVQRLIYAVVSDVCSVDEWD